ncbi:hypothetical protein [Stygiobacter electus]
MERKQDWNEVILTYKKKKEIYQSYEYQIIDVPKRTVYERADFV